MEQHERDYVRSLSFGRKMQYFRDRWGACPSMSIDLVQQPDNRWVVVGSAAVLQPLLAAELNWPPPVILTARVHGTTSLERFVADLLECWEKALIDHNRDLAAD